MKIDWAIVTMFVIAVPFWLWAAWLASKDDDQGRRKADGREQ